MTLIELVMMIAIGAYLFVGMSRGYATLVQRAIDNRNYSVALELGKIQMAIINNATYASLASGSPASDASFPNFTFTQTVSTVVTSAPYTIKKIQLDVKIGANTIVSLNTYRSDVITFGNGF